MMDKLKTYGEFIAAVEETQCIYAQTFLEEWKALATEEKWQKIRPMPLTKELVLAFAEDMANYFRETISSTCGEELYAEEKNLTTEELLAKIHREAEEVEKKYCLKIHKTLPVLKVCA